jgi:hypothetical protein
LTSRIAPRALSPAENERTLLRSVLDGCAHAAMLGCGEAFLTPFAIALGAEGFVLGLLLTLPLVVGSLAQLLAVRCLNGSWRRRPLVVIPAALQALSWIPLFIVPTTFGGYGPELVVLMAVPYFALGAFGAPAWNSWMGELVEPSRRGDYFGRRDRLRTVCQVVALFSGGWFLSSLEEDGKTIEGFAWLFGLACIARLVSTAYLASMDEPPRSTAVAQKGDSLWSFVRGVPKDNFGRFVLYVACMQAATQLAGPYFALYMLRDLSFSYFQFIVGSSVCILLQALTFHNWGRIGDQFGNLAVLRITGIALPIVPLLWLISPSFEAILIYQAISGLVWAGFNLSAANFIFDNVPPASRARAVAHYNFFVNGGMLVGALTGGLLAPLLPRTLVIFGATIELVSSLQCLFVLSAGARVIVELAFSRVIREVRTVERTQPWRVFLRVVGIQPIRGLRFSVFGGVHPSELGGESGRAAKSTPAPSTPPEDNAPSGETPSPESRRADSRDDEGRPELDAGLDPREEQASPAENALH